MAKSTKELYAIGETPPIGVVPNKMHAWVIREKHFGEPKDSFKQDVINVPEIASTEVLVYVMAAGVNYNNVWAALGDPVNIIKSRNIQGDLEDFHIGGSDASGIVYRIGKDVSNVKVGDEVIVHCGTWDKNCQWVQSGKDPMYSPSFKIWGYETNYGSFAQFTKVQDHQCMLKPKHMSWEAASSYTLVGATAYRMLLGWGRHSVKQDDIVLVWGGAGGLGSMAIQISRAVGAIPIAVVSNDEKIPYCENLGAKGCINRKHFDHWGMLPHWKDTVGYNKWLKGVRSFGTAIWDILGEKRNPKIILEHPGESTMPTSMFVCDTGGLVVICAGTTGYNATVDLRYLWMRQKRIQGSHFANDEQANSMNELAMDGYIDPCLSRTFTYEELPEAHQLMYENKHPHGNMGILIGANELNTGISSSSPRIIGHVTLPADDIHDTPHPYPLSVPLPDINNHESEAIILDDDGTRVKDLMSRNLVTCSQDDSVAHIAVLMIRHDIHAVLVKKAEEVIGVVSQTDMVLARQGRTREQALKLTARSIMTAGCVTCDVDALLSEAVSTMTGLRIHRLIVTEKRDVCNVPIGVLSMTDIISKIIVETE